MFRQFWLRDATHINSIGLGNPLKRTCATCHNAQMTGQDLSAGWVDLGTNKLSPLDGTADFASAAKAKSVEITAQRGATLLSNGKVLTESATISAERAEKVAALLRGLGTDAASVKIHVVSDVPKTNGVSDSENRMVSIRVTP